MSAWQKLRVFMPQFIGAAIVTAAAMGLTELKELGGHPVICVPLVVILSVSGLTTVLSTFVKLDKITTPKGWASVAPAPKCQRCVELETERDLLLEAIK